MSNLPRALLELKDLTDRMPAVVAPSLQPPEAAACEACHQQFAVTEFIWHWTGIIRARDLLCPLCAAQALKDSCQLACLSCRTVVTRMQKFKDRTGFLFEAGKFYHLRDCPHCLKGKLEPDTQRRAEIVELELYKKNIYGKQN